MIDSDRLLHLFLDLVRIDSPSGKEDLVAERVRAELAALGIGSERDHAGNVLSSVPGRGEPILLNAHLDSVSPCCGIRPVERDGIVSCDGETVLGADDKAGVAVILEVVRALGPDEGRRPALELVFTVQEEVGLVGAKALNYSRLRAKRALVLDGTGPAGTLWTAAPGQNNLSVAVQGRAAHAGACPEEGISAIVAASRAIARMKLGRIDFETTANVGTIAGGTARNIVPDSVHLEAEARSHDEGKLVAQTDHMLSCFEESAAEMGATASVTVIRSYDAFKLTESDPLVQELVGSARRMGLEPTLKAGGGGSDCNIFNRNGIRSLVMGVGYENPHTSSERLVVAEMRKTAELLLTFLKER